MVKLRGGRRRERSGEAAPPRSAKRGEEGTQHQPKDGREGDSTPKGKRGKKQHPKERRVGSTSNKEEDEKAAPPTREREKAAPAQKKEEAKQRHPNEGG